MSVEPVPRIGTGRCGCAGTDCTCNFTDSDTVLVSGEGSASDPVELDIINPRVYLNVVDSGTVNLTKTGSGIPTNPIHIYGSATSAGVAVTTITASGSYSVPATASMLSIKAVAGGGGGGGGQVAATGANGGGGGQGGSMTEVQIPTSKVGASLTITIGAAGAQGTGASSGGGTGTDGTDGGDTTVADGSTVIAFAEGGEGGEAGGNGGTGGNDTLTGTIAGGRGASSVGSGVQSNGPSTCRAPSGGGAGYSLTGANAAILASQGGDPLCLGTEGGDYTLATPPHAAALSYAGGGGGDYSARGGNGGTYGGGGGGGGADITGTGAAGDGGNGAAGFVEIAAW